MLKIKTRIKEYCELIKIEHSIFALPFALSGMLIANQLAWPDIETFIWVIIALISGRTAAMSLNRLIDKDIDKINPRTCNRALPEGRIKPHNALILAVFSFIIMIYAVLHLPLICKILLPIAIFIIVLYSYTKRFTYMCHFILGFVLGSAAIGGWLAVSGEISLPCILWGLAVMLWVAGFDIIYSLMDYEFDCKNNIFSLPACLGKNKALQISRILHILTVISLIAVAITINADIAFWIMIVYTGLMLFWEQKTIDINHIEKLNMSFFTINGLISIGVLLIIFIGRYFELI